MKKLIFGLIVLCSLIATNLLAAPQFYGPITTSTYVGACSGYVKDLTCRSTDSAACSAAYYDGVDDSTGILRVTIPIDAGSTEVKGWVGRAVPVGTGIYIKITDNCSCDVGYECR